MTITLTSDQLAWIKAHVGSGEFASVEEAVRRLLDERINEREVDELGDLSWMKPLVEEAVAEVERGEVVTLEELKADMRRALESPEA
jgi:antitoxin ParD1/3/4